MKGVIVFVKNPEYGKVKTRLAATVGDEKAMEIYLKLLDYTRSVLMKVNDVKRYVYYSSFVDPSDAWTETDFEKKLQDPSGLGQRMSSAFQSTFQACDKAIIIGSDCAQLTPYHIEEAFEKLNDHDLVIGPSLDGGYYLLGMNDYHPQMFEDIVWSTDTVYKETLQKAAAHNLEVYKLEALSDIDYEEDWNKYGF